MSTSLGIIQLAVIMERFTIHKLYNIQAGQYIYQVSLYSAGESYQVEAGVLGPSGLVWLCGQSAALCDLSVLSWFLEQKEQMCWDLQFGNEQTGRGSLFQDLQMPL